MTAAKAHVRVKPLEWTGSETNADAECATGEYEIESGWKDKIGGIRWFAWIHRTHDDGSVPYFHGTEAPTLEAAKAAAQADYESRILSAIEVEEVAP